MDEKENIDTLKIKDFWNALNGAEKQILTDKYLKDKYFSDISDEDIRFIFECVVANKGFNPDYMFKVDVEGNQNKHTTITYYNGKWYRYLPLHIKEEIDISKNKAAKSLEWLKFFEILIEEADRTSIDKVTFINNLLKRINGLRGKCKNILNK